MEPIAEILEPGAVGKMSSSKMPLHYDGLIPPKLA